MLHAVPWFLLGSLWAVLYCEYRAYRRRMKLVAHIQMLENELMLAEDHYLSEQNQNDLVRAELLKFLAAARAKRRNRISTTSLPQPAE